MTTLWKAPATGVIFLAVTSAIVVALLASITVFVARPLSESKNLSAQSLMDRCVTSLTGKANGAFSNLDDADAISVSCYNHARGALILDDFRIRRAAYTQQQLQGSVLLWMVVAVTVSGVGFAGLQLYAAYGLSTSVGKKLKDTDSSSITIEAGKISIRSSVTGLLILAVSLIFFAIYVQGVYKMDDKSADQPSRQRVEVRPQNHRTSATLRAGGAEAILDSSAPFGPSAPPPATSDHSTDQPVTSAPEMTTQDEVAERTGAEKPTK